MDERVLLRRRIDSLLDALAEACRARDAALNRATVAEEKAAYAENQWMSCLESKEV